jgi:hypothetical protein
MTDRLRDRRQALLQTYGVRLAVLAGGDPSLIALEREA